MLATMLEQIQAGYDGHNIVKGYNDDELTDMVREFVAHAFNGRHNEVYAYENSEIIDNILGELHCRGVQLFLEPVLAPGDICIEVRSFKGCGVISRAGSGF